MKDNNNKIQSFIKKRNEIHYTIVVDQTQVTELKLPCFTSDTGLALAQL